MKHIIKSKVLTKRIIPVIMEIIWILFLYLIFFYDAIIYFKKIVGY